MDSSSSRYSYVSSLTRTFAKRVVGREAARPIEVTDSSSSSIGETTHNAPPLPVCEEVTLSSSSSSSIVTLSWSDIIFRKTMKIRSAAPSRGEAVTLQVSYSSIAISSHALTGLSHYTVSSSHGLLLVGRRSSEDPGHRGYLLRPTRERRVLRGSRRQGPDCLPSGQLPVPARKGPHAADLLFRSVAVNLHRSPRQGQNQYFRSC